MREKSESNAIRVFDPRVHKVKVGDVKSAVHIYGGKEATVVPAAVRWVGERGFYCENSRLGLQEMHLFEEGLNGQLFREYRNGEVLLAYASQEDVNFWRRAAKTMPRMPSTGIRPYDGKKTRINLNLGERLNRLVGVKNVIRAFNPEAPDVAVGDVYLVPCIGHGPARAVPAAVVAVDKCGFDYEDLAFGIRERSQLFREPLRGFLFREYGKGRALSIQGSAEGVEDYRACLKAEPLAELPESMREANSESN